MIRGRSLSCDRRSLDVPIPPLKRALSACEDVSDKVWCKLHARADFLAATLCSKSGFTSAGLQTQPLRTFADEQQGEDFDSLSHNALDIQAHSLRQKGKSFERTRRHMRPQRISRACLVREVSPRLLRCRRNQGLRRNCQQVDPAAAVSKPFNLLCDSFQRHYSSELRFAFGGQATVSPAPVATGLKRMFLDSLKGNPDSAIRLGYHGTAIENLPSILQQGLRVPGNGGVRVVNGAAHGVGIYTASMGHADLSQGFVRGGNSMLVCGIIDEPDEQSMPRVCHKAPKAEAAMLKCGRPVKQRHRAEKPTQSVAPQAVGVRMGRFDVRKRTKHVLHVGAAQVVFAERHVVPLLRVDHMPSRLYRAQWHASAEEEAPVSTELEFKEEPAQQCDLGDMLPPQELRLRRRLCRVRRERATLHARALKMARAFGGD